MTDSYLVLAIVVVYLLIVIGVGHMAARVTSGSREDFLMASRSFGLVVLFFALFATNMTAVTMIGAPGLAYGTGASAYGFFVALFAFLFPVFLFTCGYRIWLTGKEFGHITPGQIVNHRWEAKYLGAVLMVMFTFWTIPYILVGVQGSGIVFESLTDGLIPYWLGALIIIVVVGLYVYSGGMRGTGWTNTFQGAVFMVILLGFFVAIPLRLGGFESATFAVAELNDGTFLNRAGVPVYEPRIWFSQGIIISLGAFMFPHLVIRYMTARSVLTLRQTAVVYPAAVIVVWIPAVLIGFWGIAQLPDLANPDFVLPEMVFELLPTWVIGIALAGILAALMSSIDAQVLTLSTFFTEDVLEEFSAGLTERKSVIYTRLFLVVVFLLAYIGALLTDEAVIDTATFAFAGYGLMFVPFTAAFYWRESTKESVYFGLIYGFVGLWAFQIGLAPDALAFGFHPFVVLLLTQVVLMSIITYFTAPPAESRIRSYENIFEDTW
ncbi:sodium:solute symporter family protein [Natrialbaceae archaeon A-gly3]